MIIEKADHERYAKSFNSIDGLAQTVRRLIQEVEVLKSILKESGLWNDDQYRKAITERFLADFNSAGMCSYRSHSDYCYSLDEVAFLKQRFQASEDQIKAFTGEADYLSSLT